MIIDQTAADATKPHSAQEPANKQRRRLIGGAIGGALLAALSASGRAMAEGPEAPSDPFILLLKGVYQPVVHGPNLGLTGVDLNDGSYSRNRIYPVFGIADTGNEDTHESSAIGTFFVQFHGKLAVYQLPGGAMKMSFESGKFTPHADGHGGFFLEGTFELTILQATGVYRAFQGGHNHMVDRLHQLADGRFDEFCFCVISTYPFP